MPSIDLSSELEIAVGAVRQAARVCENVRKEMAADDALRKADRSPVTVADFASQAVICAALSRGSAIQAVMAEESAGELAKPALAETRAGVVEQVGSALGEAIDERQVLKWIDQGAWRPGPDAGAYWTLDPVDGTKGFLRGGQYAVALSLIDWGRVLLGVLGCPGLPAADGRAGILVCAALGGGATERPLFQGGAAEPIRVVEVNSLSEARWCESFEPDHSDQRRSAEIAARLGLNLPPLRVDSQVKYALLSRGQASIFIRIPKRADYRDKVWDHAAGAVIAQEAGGTVTDLGGKSLDFSRGEALHDNYGIVASTPWIHDKALDAVKAVLSSCGRGV